MKSGRESMPKPETAEMPKEEKKKRNKRKKKPTITKMPLQRLGGGAGILVDDLVAGAMAGIVLQVGARLLLGG